MLDMKGRQYDKKNRFRKTCPRSTNFLKCGINDGE